MEHLPPYYTPPIDRPGDVGELQAVSFSAYAFAHRRGSASCQLGFRYIEFASEDPGLCQGTTKIYENF